MISLLPKCSKCGSPVAESIESQIEQHEKIKMGNYINSEWICDDCLAAEKKEEKEHSSPMQTSQSNANQCDCIGTASESDVSPNTPRADEANVWSLFEPTKKQEVFCISLATVVTMTVACFASIAIPADSIAALYGLRWYKNKEDKIKPRNQLERKSILLQSKNSNQSLNK